MYTKAMKMWGLALLMVAAPVLGWADGYYGDGYYARAFYSPRTEYVTRYVDRPVTRYVDRVVERQVASNTNGERVVSVRTSGRGSYNFNVSRGGGYNSNNGYTGSGAGTISSPHRGDYEAYLMRLQQYQQQVERAYARGGGTVCGNYLRRPEDCKTMDGYGADDDAALRSWPY